MTGTTDVRTVIPSPPTDRDRPRPRIVALIVGVAAAALSIAGAGASSYWGDEAASVLSATRSLPSLFGMLAHVDAVHGAYYLCLHAWTGLVGTAEAAVRFPSGVAIGLAAAGTVLLGEQLFGLRVGILAGLVFAIIPQTTRMGAEARSSAFAIAAGVWMTVWFVSLVRRREARRWMWALYGLGVAASAYVFLYLVLLVVVHGVGLVVIGTRRAAVRRWAQSMVLAGVVAAPILLLGLAQRGQIEFLARRSYATAWSVFVRQWFGSPAFAILAWGLIAVALVATVVRGRHPWRPGILIAITWLAVPTSLLLAGNAWVSPMYNLRYVAYCLPAVALLVAIGVDCLAGLARDRRSRRLALVVALVALCVAAAPRYAAQRGPYAKDGGSDLRQTAAVVAAHAVAGDAVVFDQSTKPSRRPRLALDLYPSSFTGLDDVALLEPYANRSFLWDRVARNDAVHARVVAHRTVWVVEAGADRSDVDAVRSLGYRLVRAFPVHRTTVYELSKE
ncbi:glycosyltransferase family 39 protein [Agromyces sp. MMS24-JH15]|uniref:glycosyltransferase family 39 protein n=1 Tax=Agromyces sp. MMS24-JH15 TaxID=3243765 RepID=UPI0037498E18